MERQQVQALLPTGQWVTVARWDAAGADYDAEGWCEKVFRDWGRVIVELPGGGCLDLSKVIAVRAWPEFL